jgi:hypothetical protein
MTTGEVVLWWVVAVAVGWAAIWQIRGAITATVALAIEVTIAVADIYAFHRMKKKDERRSLRPDAPKE